MTTLIPTSSTNVEAYEDMFKEITRKLYGEETGHGLHTLGTPVAHVATGGPTAPEGERSFTTLISDRSLTTIDYDHVNTESNNLFKTDDHLTTAFGLAALMQNGFPPPGAILNPHSFVSQKQQQQSANSSGVGGGGGGGSGTSSGSTAATNLPTSSVPPSTSSALTTTNSATTEEKWPPPSEDCLPWATSNNNKNTSFNVPQKMFKGKKQDHDPNNTTTSKSNAQTNSGGPKRYNCSSCPYSTDRRDLFTRHENIHKEEKPFHCYVCLKQFNRADHVKKHFLRMHRGIAYDISRTKRITTTNSRKNTSQYFPQTAGGNAATTTGSDQQQNHQTGTTLTIPTNTYQNPQQQQSQQQQQQQQQQNNADPSNLNTNQMSGAAGTSQIIPQQLILKQEKVEKPPKRKGEKRFVCCYCPWSGTDNWGLKRHLNTHTKPYVCMLCDYKAARSERLATHVFKVHNKKVCGKCNFLADNQEEYQTHINEAHAHDTRPQRNSNNNSESAANVLRTIGNTFNIPNSQLNTIHNVATGHVFGNNMSDNLVNNTNNTNNNIGNNWRQTATSSSLMSSGGSGTTVESTSTIQKRGAERLFQYMEADGSDPEDYTRQLQMAALSRNTASVAQDFHNAGGGVKTFTSIHSAEDNYRKIIMSHMKIEAASSTIEMPWRQEHQLQMNASLTRVTTGAPTTYGVPFWKLQHQQQQQQQYSSQTLAFKNVSPPAPNPSHNQQQQQQSILPSSTLPAKKRRKVSHEKENENIFLQQQQQPPPIPASHLLALANTNIKDHFDSYIRAQFYHPKKLNLQTIIAESTTKDNNNRQCFKFTSHPELEVSLSTATSNPIPPEFISHDLSEAELTERLFVEKRNRKQAQPRKVIETNDVKLEPGDTSTTVNGLSADDSIQNQIRDKHLNRMVSKKKSCNICSNRNRCMIMPYHTTASLILHKLWQHSTKVYRCRQTACESKFKKSYQLRLHHKLVHLRSQ